MDGMKNVTKVLWFALLFSNSVFAYLVWSGLMGEGAKEMSQMGYVFLGIGLVMSVGAFLFYKSSTGEDKIRESLQKVDLNSVNLQNNNLYKDYDQLDESTKRKMIIANQMMVKSILTWALIETVNIFGVMGIISFFTTVDFYYYHFATAIVLMFLTFPSYLARLEEIR
jgi:hypothetical protein